MTLLLKIVEALHVNFLRPVMDGLAASYLLFADNPRQVVYGKQTAPIFITSKQKFYIMRHQHTLLAKLVRVLILEEAIHPLIRQFCMEQSGKETSMGNWDLNMKGQSTLTAVAVLHIAN